jgi:hypothetical protein
VDLLEANEEYVACFHNVKILETSGDLVEDYITQYETIEDLARDGNDIHTPSVFFKHVINSFPEEMQYSPMGDFFLYMLLAEHGKFKYLSEAMAVYRAGVGVWSSKKKTTIAFNTLKIFLAVYCSLSHNTVVQLILKKRINSLLRELLPILDAELLKTLRFNNIASSLLDELILRELKMRQKDSEDNQSIQTLIKELYAKTKQRIFT